jgi:hypothetical protein
LTKKFSVPDKVVEGSVESVKLFGPNDCVVHNFIIEQNSNGHDAHLPEAARELKIEDPRTVANCGSVTPSSVFFLFAFICYNPCFTN